MGVPYVLGQHAFEQIDKQLAGYVNEIWVGEIKVLKENAVAFGGRLEQATIDYGWKAEILGANQRKSDEYPGDRAKRDGSSGRDRNSHHDICTFGEEVASLDLLVVRFFGYGHLSYTVTG